MLASTAVLVTACGSRGPLDFDILSITSDAATIDAAVVDAPDDAPRDAVADGRREAGPSALQCGACLAQQCGQSVLQCVQSPSCQRILQCVTQKCLAGGTQDPKCIIDCASGDFKGAAQVLSIFQCITALCGADCSAVLGGLGGGFPGGGGRDGGRALPDPRDDDRPPRSRDLPTEAERRHILRESFSQWPELCAPSD